MSAERNEETTSEVQTPEIADRGYSLLVVADELSMIQPLPDRGTVVIGRSREADLCLDVHAVSRRHAALTIGETITIEDLGSSNGTRVRGEPIAPGRPIPVAVNDVVEIGSVVVIVQRAVASRPKELLASTDLAPPVDVGLMERLHGIAASVAAGKISVLLLGETGVGKELMAERIHRLSPRASGPLVRISCAAFSDTLLESELFGHERGAFTGADRAKPGIFETAEQGTIFLDEVGEIPLGLQPKLLRVLEERKVMRLGGLQARPIDVRFIAATNRDLEIDVERGSFRADLYYRLSGATLVIPPLRERIDEIEPLARSFATRAAAELGKPGDPEVSPAALSILRDYAWPGNVRELRNVIERAVLLCGGGPVLPVHLPLDKMRAAIRGAAERPTTGGGRRAAAPRDDDFVDASPTLVPLRDGVVEYERRRIVEVLGQCQWNQTQAARLLGISRMTLASRMESFGLPRPRKPRA